MANIKITDLTAYTDPATTDVVPIVDVGNDITKKVSVGEVVGKISGDVDVATDGTSSITAGAVTTTELGGDITTAGKALLDDADAAAQRTTLGLATVASTGALDDLTDVDVTTTPPNDGEALVWDDGASEWVPGSAGATAAGSANEIQYNDGASGLAASSDLTWDDTAKELGVGGDINLDDGGTYATTLQLITPTANRTISFPDATGTVGLVGGSSGQLIYNNAGAYAGAPSTSVGATGNITLSLAGAASTPPVSLTGSWFSGGTSTTTKPQLLIEPNGTTSTAWSTSGTGFGVNAPSGFTGNLLDLQKDGTSLVRVDSSGTINDAINFKTTYIEFLYAGTVRGIAGVDDGAAMFKLPDSGFFGWAPSAAVNATYDLALFRDAAGTLAQRNGANAQTYRLYNTFTDASNYERAYLRWASNVLEIGTEGAGTGSEQPVRITAATLKLPNLPTYADNAAATSGGLVAGDVYKTATGELRITV